MTNVIELAKQAGCAPEDGQSGFWVAQTEDLERFATLVRNATLDEAAQYCNGRLVGALQSADWWSGFKTARNQCIAAIESLKEPT